MTSIDQFDPDQPAETAALVPYMLRFYPHDQLVIVLLRGRHIITAAATTTSNSAYTAESAATTAKLVAAHKCDGVILIGYGTHEAVTNVLALTRAALNADGIAIPAMLRIHDDRLWYIDHDALESPADGIPFDPHITAAAAHATYLGWTAADSGDAVARLTPITGAEREAMRIALADAHKQIAEIESVTAGSRTRWHDLVEELINEALATYQQHRHLPDDRVALILALLTDPELENCAIERLAGEDIDVRMWTDLTRRADDLHAAAPATLLALAAVQQGDSLLAQLAIERAYESDPDDTLIQAIAIAMAAGVLPAVVRGLLHG
ncbi:DUF4192 domain-containing protein [Actinoplanes sp. NPDC023714]|uniref:DUF4192 domain-containing protein n=1 Tax=Actinoplanes sp. NPDC023714 TaxID=3154322 RepID=UPI0033CA31D4